MWWWVLTAAAGPLDLPDPDDMGRFQCRDRPVGLENDAELGDLELTEEPPGPPTFATGLSGELVPHATDQALKKASKGKNVHVMAAVASLASGGQPVVLGCTAREATAQDEFQVGCKKPLPCQVVAVLDGKPYTLERANKFGPRLAPIEEAREALGLVAILDRDVFVPLTRAEKEAWTEQAAGYQAVEAGVPWVEVEEHDEGWVVRAPRKVACGCEHDVVRRAWWVSRDGRSCQIEETPIPLAKAKEPACAED